MSTVALAVKYRPNKFDDVVEQGSVKTILSQQLESGEIRHAYLFCGGAGTGKTTTARIFANEINQGHGVPMEMDAASNNSVNDVRNIIQQSRMATLDGSKYRIFIIDECHALSGSAWQAMLKLLEEPPETAIFIFCTTDPQKIPKTILSRVQRYDFQRISQDGIVNRLKYIVDQEWKENPDWDAECDTDALEYIAKLADGGMRDAITLLDKCLAYSKDLVIEDVVEAVGAVDFDEMLHLVDALVENVKESPSTVITVIEDLHRQGKDLKLFVRNFTNFVLDLCKFAVTDTLDFTQIPNYYKDALSVRMKQSLYYSECNELLRTLLKLNSEIKWDTYPKAMIEATLYSFCVGGMTNGKDILQT